MTDEQIIKALECCLNADSRFECYECNYHDKAHCLDSMIIDTLNLINRQKAEIERLQGILLAFMDEVARWESKEGIDVSRLPLIPICDEGRNSIDRIRAKAINQFAERLKEKERPVFPLAMVIDVYEIDNLVKEMVGAESGS